MKSIFAVLAAALLIPVALAAGYAAATLTAPAPTVESVVKAAHMRAGLADVEWYYVLEAGPFKGHLADVWAVVQDPKEFADGHFERVTCTGYTDAPVEFPNFSTQNIAHCASEHVTLAEVKAYLRGLEAKEPSA